MTRTVSPYPATHAKPSESLSKLDTLSEQFEAFPAVVAERDVLARIVVEMEGQFVALERRVSALEHTVATMNVETA